MIKIESCPVCSERQFNDFMNCVDYTVTKESFQLMTCTSCGFLITNPQPSKENLVKYYLSDDYISHSGKAHSLIDSLYLFLRKRSLRWKLSLLPESKGNILDYGCGTGEFLKTCQSAGWSISGVEPSEIARKKAESLTGIKIETETIRTVKQYDVITLWHVLEHIDQLNEMITTLSVALKKDGKVMIAVPNHKCYDALYYEEYWAGYDVPRHLWHFTQSSIKELLKKNGLTIVDVIPMKLDAFYVSMLSEKYKSGKNSIIQLLKAFFIGLRSNWKARNNSEYSSLIYVAQK